jgi:hypothetical protein
LIVSNTDPNSHGKFEPESILTKGLREFFTASQWSALMTDLPFQRFMQSSNERDRDLVLAYALEVLRKRPSDEPPTPTDGQKN